VILKIVEKELERIRSDLDVHISQFNKHKKEQEKWNQQMLDMIKCNQETNRKLAVTLIQVEENTRPLVEWSKDISGAARLGKRLRDIAIIVAFLGGVVAYVWDKL
jgi:hypothetical protein